MQRLTFILCASLLAAATLLTGLLPRAGGVRAPLRVCADPNNLPFSNDRGEGFENNIAALLAREWRRPLEYAWWPQRRGFIRNTLNAHRCDLVIGAPADYGATLTSAPYYRSTYVFVYRRDAGFQVDSFDSPVLRERRVGVQLVGDDGNNSPPAHALSRRGVIRNVRGFRVTEDYAQPNPPARIIEAVARGDIDVAVAWGPMASYFAARQPVTLTVTPVSPASDGLQLPFVFDIAMGVRRGEDVFKRQLDDALKRRRADIERILDTYAVPRR